MTDGCLLSAADMQSVSFRSSQELLIFSAGCVYLMIASVELRPPICLWRATLFSQIRATKITAVTHRADCCEERIFHWFFRASVSPTFSPTNSLRALIILSRSSEGWRVELKGCIILCFPPCCLDLMRPKPLRIQVREAFLIGLVLRRASPSLYF